MANKIDYDAVLADLENRKALLEDAILAIKTLALSAPREAAPKEIAPVKRGRKPKAPKVDASDLSTEWPEGSTSTSCEKP